ncbi:MAG: GPW/gp25 family protein [Thauera sp.]|jgi:phage baseplate assembly protein W|nr:GPW/gp25 family protein [Thauera sp.]
MHGINALTGKPLTGIEHLRQSIRDILTTRIGTRVMRRDYGSDVPRLVDAAMTPRLAMNLYMAVAVALDKWEPRFRLTRVQITDAAPGKVTLAVEGIYLPDGKPIVMQGLEID